MEEAWKRLGRLESGGDLKHDEGKERGKQDDF